MSEHDTSKRQFIKTAAYVAPLILTLNAAPSFAAIGSVADGGIGNGGGSWLGNGRSGGLGKRQRHNRLFAMRRHHNTKPHRGV